MINRNGWVSNSSSSSFIIIGGKNHYKPKVEDPLVINNKFAGGQFGWGPETISGWENMVAWAYIMAHELKRNDWKHMLDTVLKRYLNIKDIQWPETFGYNEDAYWYIDHQSVHEDNASMYKNEDTLINFIFSNDSRIMLDNDNK